MNACSERHRRQRPPSWKAMPHARAATVPAPRAQLIRGHLSVPRSTIACTMSPSEPPFSQTIVMVRAAQAGDRDALGGLFERYLPRVREMVSKRIGRELRGFLDIDDVVQESMKDAFLGIARFREENNKAFLGYISRIVEN